MDPNPETTHGQTPDEQVARLIVDRLNAAQLVPPSRSGEIAAGLASGSLKAEDWRFFAEQALEMEARDEEAKG